MMFSSSLRLSFVALALAAGATGALAQETKVEPLKRVPLQRADFPPDKYATISTMVIVQPNAPIARHTHPGIETGYVIEGGGLKLKVGDGPELTLDKGSSYLVPAGAPHGGVNGSVETRIIATFIVEREKPLATPAPQ